MSVSLSLAGNLSSPLLAQVGLKGQVPDEESLRSLLTSNRGILEELLEIADPKNPRIAPSNLKTAKAMFEAGLVSVLPRDARDAHFSAFMKLKDEIVVERASQTGVRALGLNDYSWTSRISLAKLRSLLGAGSPA